LESQQTDIEGKFQFDHLMAGTYFIAIPADTPWYGSRELFNHTLNAAVVARAALNT